MDMKAKDAKYDRARGMRFIFTYDFSSEVTAGTYFPVPLEDDADGNKPQLQYLLGRSTSNTPSAQDQLDFEAGKLVQYIETEKGSWANNAAAASHLDARFITERAAILAKNDKEYIEPVYARGDAASGTWSVVT